MYQIRPLQSLTQMNQSIMTTHQAQHHEAQTQALGAVFRALSVNMVSAKDDEDDGLLQLENDPWIKISTPRGIPASNYENHP